jgi:oxygen-dependent protoporphyrinogen oxidase
MASVAIIGGGISGLSAAYYLPKAGIPSTLIEARPRVGGVIQTERMTLRGRSRPDSFLPSAVIWISCASWDRGEVIRIKRSPAKTFIRRRGRMVALPDGVQMLVPTQASTRLYRRS